MSYFDEDVFNMNKSKKDTFTDARTNSGIKRKRCDQDASGNGGGGGGSSGSGRSSSPSPKRSPNLNNSRSSVSAQDKASSSSSKRQRRISEFFSPGPRFSRAGYPSFLSRKFRFYLNLIQQIN